MKLILIKLMLI